MANRKSRAKERREAREKQRRRNRQLTIAGGLIAVVVVIGFLALVSTAPAEAELPANAGAIYEGIETGETEEGFPRLGDPQAPVTVEEYSSFSCSHCADFHDTVLPSIIERVRNGDINFVFVPYYIRGGVPNGEGAARAALCAGEQGDFWSMHDVLFDWHKRYANAAFNSNRLTAAADGLGLNMDSFNGCFGSEGISDTLQLAIADGNLGTPTVFVNNVATENVSLTTVMNAIDAAVDAAGPREPRAIETEEVIVTEEAAATEEMVETEEAAATEEMVETEEAVATEEMVETEEAAATEEMVETEEAVATEESE